jgi:DNA-3-methyladenine glycosylase I
MEKSRCQWTKNNDLMNSYHDEEWGVPLHEDYKIFEYFTLSAFQAGLSWSTILKKRNSFRIAFDNFDFYKIALYNENKFNELLNDSQIIRNKLKISSAIENAGICIKIKNEFGSLNNYFWQFVDHSPVINQWKTLKELPAKTELSDKISSDLKNRGFRFAGSTICYAFMQSIGMVNDHIISCFRHDEIAKSE